MFSIISLRVKEEISPLRILDVGCGNNKTVGAIGLDSNPGTQADVIHDLNVVPYPFRENEFDEVVCNHVIEHVAEVLAFMEELHRVAKPGATIRIVTPHYSNARAYADPTHRRYLSAAALDCFVKGSGRVSPGFFGRLLETDFPAMEFYSSARFEKVGVKLSFGRPFRLSGIGWLANRFSKLYEMYFSFVFPARDIYFTLRVEKDLPS